jgi:tetratricopeptide (TPR) repeat protein
MGDAAPFVVSVIALLVSIYSVWSKNLESRRQTQLRLNAVVDELNKVTYELNKDSDSYVESGRTVPAALYTVANGRREILCSEAVQLSKLVRGGLTMNQLRTVAAGLSSAGHLREAESLLQEGVGRAHSGLERVFALRGHGLVLMRMGRFDEGRQAFEGALTVNLDESDERHWHRAETLIQWASQELNCGDRTLVRGLLSRAESESHKVISRSSFERLAQLISRELRELESVTE